MFTVTANGSNCLTASSIKDVTLMTKSLIFYQIQMTHKMNKFHGGRKPEKSDKCLLLLIDISHTGALKTLWQKTCLAYPTFPTYYIFRGSTIGYSIK